MISLKMLLRWAWMPSYLMCWQFAVASLAAAAEAPAVAAGNPESGLAVSEPAPVRFRNQILFTIAAPIGELTATQRAAAIEQRLLAVAGGAETILQKLRITDRDTLSELFAGDVLIRTVTDQDAASTGRTRRQLAADQLLLVQQALATEFQERGTAHVLRGLAITAALTIVLFVLLFALRWLYRRASARLARSAKAWSWSSGIARLNLATPAAVAGAAQALVTMLATLVALTLAYLYLEYVLSLFPWTRGYGQRMVDAVTKAVAHVLLGLLAYLPNLLNIAVIVVVARYILKALHGFFGQLARERLSISGFHPSWGLPTYSLVRFLVLVISVVMVFPYLPGSGSAGFQGVSAFVGLLISFGAAPAISNVISGIIITYMRPFRSGDRVKIADTVGDVVSKNLLVVRLKTIKNVEVTIPNALVLANHIINYSTHATDDGLILNTTVSIGYDTPWQTVHELLIGAAGRVDGLLAEPAPFVLQTGLDDFYVCYELNVYTKLPNAQATLYSLLHAEIQNAFNERGVEILSPHFAAVRDGNRKAVPDDYLPKDYKAPGFNLLSRILRPGSGN